MFVILTCNTLRHLLAAAEEARDYAVHLDIDSERLEVTINALACNPGDDLAQVKFPVPSSLDMNSSATTVEIFARELATAMQTSPAVSRPMLVDRVEADDWRRSWAPGRRWS